MSRSIETRTGRLVSILGQQHIKSWLDPLALHFNFIFLPLANFWTLGLHKFNTSIFLHLRLPPECRVFDGDFDHFLATGLLIKHNLSPQDLAVLLVFPGLTNNDISFISRFGYLRPNE